MILKPTPDIINEAMAAGGRLSDVLRLFDQAGINLNKQPHPAQPQVQNYRLNPAGLSISGPTRPAMPAMAPINANPMMGTEASPLLMRLKNLDDLLLRILSA